MRSLKLNEDERNQGNQDAGGQPTRKDWWEHDC